MATSAQVSSTPSPARVRAAKARRRLLINASIVVVVLVAGLLFWNSRRNQSAAPAGLITGRVERTDLVQIISATGSVTAQTGAKVNIGSQITGRIKRLHADVGDEMKAGEVIAELDVPDLRANVSQAQATLALNQRKLSEQRAGVAMQNTQTRTDIDKAKAGVSVAQASLNQVQQSASLQLNTAQAVLKQAEANDANSAANLRRNQQLFQQGYVAASDVDNAKAQAAVNAAQVDSARENVHLVQTKVDADLRTAREQLKQAQATLAAAQAAAAQNTIKREQVAEAEQAVQQSAAQLAFSKAQLDKAFIRTPISGTVLQLTQQQGETIAAGLSAPTVIIVANLDKLQVDAFVDETDIGKVRLGQRATVQVDAYPNESFFGTVEKIASGSTMQQNVVTYDVTIALANPSHLLKPDMTATVSITVARRHNVLAVPIDAVKPTAHGATVTVANRGADGKTQYRVAPVRTGVSNDTHTEILGGLREGEEVVLAGQVPGMNTEQGGPRPPGPLGFGGGRGRGGGGAGGGGRGGR